MYMQDDSSFVVYYISLYGDSNCTNHFSPCICHSTLPASIISVSKRGHVFVITVYSSTYQFFY